jgi:hypothetical protein
MIKAIQTHYAGYWFRSRLEARWAVFFDTTGIEWRYEPEGLVVDTPEGRIHYLPDFLLPNQWGEAKGYLQDASVERVCSLAAGMTRCEDKDSMDLVILGDIPRPNSDLWPVQLHYHRGKLWGVAWDPTEAGCPMGRPHVRVVPDALNAERLTEGFPFGAPPRWAVEGLDAARQARFEFGESGRPSERAR